MKKKILSVLLITLSIGLCACNNYNVGRDKQDLIEDETSLSESEGLENTADGTEDNTQPSKTDDQLYDERLEGVAYVGGRSITINYNDSKRKDTKSDSLVFHSQTSNAIALTYDKSSSYTGTVDDVFEILNDGDLFSDISTYTGTAFGGDTAFKICGSI